MNTYVRSVCAALLLGISTPSLSYTQTVRNDQSRKIDVTLNLKARTCTLTSGDGTRCQAWLYFYKTEAWFPIQPGQTLSKDHYGYSCVAAQIGGRDYIAERLNQGDIFTGDLNALYAHPASKSEVRFEVRNGQYTGVQVRIGNQPPRSLQVTMNAEAFDNVMRDFGLKRYKCIQNVNKNSSTSF